MGDKGAVPDRTPAQTPAPAKKAGSTSTGKQNSILGYFSKSSGNAASATSSSAAARVDSSPCLKETTKSNSMSVTRRGGGASAIVTPVPSSDAAEPASSQENGDEGKSTATKKVVKAVQVLALPSPVTPAEVVAKKQQARSDKVPATGSSPSRKAKKAVNYAESSDDEDEDVFTAMQINQARRRNRTRTAVVDDDDDFDVADLEAAAKEDWDDMGDFVVSEDSDAPTKSRKRKRADTKTTAAPRKKTSASSTPRDSEQRDVAELDDDESAVPGSTAQKWRYDPNNVQPATLRKPLNEPKKAAPNAKGQAKEKAHTTTPEQRYPWLADIMDMDKNSPGHPDYNPSTLFVPPLAWKKFSPFETQYWEIKQKLWDTVVFFKKGKFYELYENDATIGHQLFDLKLTDRVNMRMVGVPESSLDMWVNQFVAKGYKVARVDQMESALGKEMRERDEVGGASKPAGKDKKDKIIRRELACILTAGTLVDGGMLQDDMATYCAAIKEVFDGEKSSFGIVFVDAATGQFYITEFEDDADLTKFGTFVAQTNPRELILEKSRLSTKALRILKNNTAPSTIWNYLKPEQEFWSADLTRRELDINKYFVSDAEVDEQADAAWPALLAEAKTKDLLMSAFGAMVHYLRVLKLERNLLSQGNFTWYSPIRRNGTLILDGQTLVNLEIFTNTADGGVDGTLFNLLNRCITPFGKRLFRQWVCHPLCDTVKINERLDAVDMFNADRTVRDQFSSQLTSMPDLERLLSRVHAGACRPQDFVKVLEGFEQIEYTTKLLGSFEGGSALVDRLIAAMPDLGEPLAYWKSAFDRRRAVDDKVIIPERGIEEDYDDVADRIDEAKRQLHDLLDRQRAALKCKALKFTDVGKEIYQIEAPKALAVPKAWQQMSATSAVKRYYFGELRGLVRELQEAEETHSQMKREVASRLFRRFDSDAETWLQAIRVVAQLDCLISLAKASAALGQPSCRPKFIDAERSVVEFEELRHPCMLNVDDFIPNDIKLGGDEPKINLLTGANAAGKSTVLRMSCIAVIMAQIGLYIPARSALLTPVDRIMSRLGANDAIFAAQSTFFVELAETRKILSDATPRSLVILDELGRGTSSGDGLAVAQATLHHVATHVGCLGYFATHYRSLAAEFARHPEVAASRMAVRVDDADRTVTFLYRLERGVADGSFGMHCAAMCGVPARVVDAAEVAARRWEVESRRMNAVHDRRGKAGDDAPAAAGMPDGYIPLGMLSDVVALLNGGEGVQREALDVLVRAVEAL